MRVILTPGAMLIFSVSFQFLRMMTFVIPAALHLFDIRNFTGKGLLVAFTNDETMELSVVCAVRSQSRSALPEFFFSKGKNV